MLKIRSLRSYYESLCILKSVSMHVEKGEIVTLIGANGSGKSTLLNSIVGLMPRVVGAILFEEKEIQHLSSNTIVKLGIALVPEGRQLFSPMSVLDNLILGTYPYYSLKNRQKLNEQIEWIFNLFPILGTRRKQLAGTLSGGEQQMLSISRALMSDPKLLLLDEPSVGLAPKIIENIFQTLGELNEKTGLTVFLVEQNVNLALDICQRGYVIETGQIILSGEREELINNKEVLRAYLGKE
ncbi:MAG: leucine/isoleucine/valine transporter ATP-binding subunit [Spirochaetes bacterium DG_61]|jgi:branched-chain amino acid transport system ATP-binding protein|nr:MAG: leucine/isoleucine/valine transporter ATP-binding subunit [Spirochaetes bacterium DG_61]